MFRFFKEEHIIGKPEKAIVWINQPLGALKMCENVESVMSEPRLSSFDHLMIF